MKGIVFTEFLEMVEKQHGWKMADELIVDAALPSEGIYTAVGTYPHQEMVKLVDLLSKKTGVSVRQLFLSYGQYLFQQFNHYYAYLFDKAQNTFEFLESIENSIHVEVRKLYPDAELPTFTYHQVSPNQLIMVYRSERPFADFAEGLLYGCIAHFDESITIEREDSSNSGREAKFILTRAV